MSYTSAEQAARMKARIQKERVVETAREIFVGRAIAGDETTTDKTELMWAWEQAELFEESALEYGLPARPEKKK